MSGLPCDWSAIRGGEDRDGSPAPTGSSGGVPKPAGKTERPPEHAVGTESVWSPTAVASYLSEGHSADYLADDDDEYLLEEEDDAPDWDEV